MRCPNTKEMRKSFIINLLKELKNVKTDKVNFDKILSLVEDILRFFEDDDPEDDYEMN